MARSRRPDTPVSHRVAFHAREETLRDRERDNARREHRRGRRLLWGIGGPLVAAAVITPIVWNHGSHEHAVAVMKQLDREHAEERKALALPYKNPKVTRVTDTHRVADGRDTFDLRLSLPITHRAAAIREAELKREKKGQRPLISWLSPASALLRPVSHNADGKPVVNPRFAEPLQGRNPGVQIDQHGDTGDVSVTLPVGHGVHAGDQQALYITNEVVGYRYADNSARDENNNRVSEDLGGDYFGDFVYEGGQDGHPGHWQYFAPGSLDAPRLPDVLDQFSHNTPHGGHL